MAVPRLYMLVIVSLNYILPANSCIPYAQFYPVENLTGEIIISLLEKNYACTEL